MDQSDLLSMKQITENPILYYMLQRLIIGVVVALDLIALLFFIIGLHRLVAKGPEDLSGALSLFGSIIGIYAIWKLALKLVIGDSAEQYLAPINRRIMILIGHLLFWGFTLVLWTVLLPKLSQVDFSRGMAASEQQQYALAIDSLTRALYKDSKNVDAHYALADIYNDLANREASIHHFYMGIYADQKFHPLAFNNLARLLLAQAEYTAALDLLDMAAARIDKGQGEETWAQMGIVSKNRAWAYWKLGLLERAKKEILKAQQSLESAQRLTQFPEISCLEALITKQSGGQSKAAERACIDNYESHTSRRRKREPFSENIRAPQGASRELYLQVFKQITED